VALVLRRLQMLSFIEISSSSYNLSLFPSKAGSDRDGGVGAAPRESSRDR
jgi:hypothetical protein